MTAPIPPDTVLTIPSLRFSPLRLCLDDVLPVSMVLLLGYKYRIDPVLLQRSLNTALQAFPHLSGRFQLNIQPLQAELVPSDRAVELEWVQSGHLPQFALEFLDQETLFVHFAPTAASTARSLIQAMHAPLLQLRLTWFSESQTCVLGIMVSHLALDGVGLILFLNHLTAAMQGGNVPEVVHDRKYTFPDQMTKNGTIPLHYQEIPNLSLAMSQVQDDITIAQAAVFSVSIASLKKYLDKSPLTDVRLFLAAHLCQEVAAIQESRRTLALWCNTRGLSHVPRSYTGNTGCYIHLPLTPGDSNECYQLLRSAITRKGFAEIKKIYSQIKSAEADGRYLFWSGPSENLLSLNLVPHVPGVANFGKGAPEYAQLLTRNVSGLRIYSSPDGNKLIVEACLPTSHCERLMSSCEKLGLTIQVWHRASLYKN